MDNNLGLSDLFRLAPGANYLTREEYESKYFKPLSKYPDYRIRLNKNGNPLNGGMSHVQAAHTRRKNKVDSLYENYKNCAESLGFIAKNS